MFIHAQGQQSEWALTKRHESEDKFGIQICGNRPELMIKCAELLSNELDIDFVDINVRWPIITHFFGLFSQSGCPIDLVFRQGAGSGLMQRPPRMKRIVMGMSSVMDIPLTVKIRTGVSRNTLIAEPLIPKLISWGASAITVRRIAAHSFASY